MHDWTWHGWQLTQRPCARWCAGIMRQQKLTKAISDLYFPLHEQALRDSEHWKGVRATMEHQMQNDRVWRDEQLPVPGSWQLMTNGSTTALRSLQLRMPNCRHAKCIHCLHCLWDPIRHGRSSVVTTCITISAVAYASNLPAAGCNYRCGLSCCMSHSSQHGILCCQGRDIELYESLAHTGVGLKSWEVSGTPQNVDSIQQTSYTNLGQMRQICQCGWTQKTPAMQLQLTGCRKRHLHSCLTGLDVDTG